MAPEIANVAARELPPLSAVASPSYGEVVLVTGGSGFLGQHVIKHLHERDPRVREIRILDLVPFLKLLDYKETKPVRWFVGDVCDPRKVQQAFQGVDCVFHCAALVSYHFPPDLEQLSRVNVTGTENILAMCINQNIPRLVYCSTSEVTLVPYLGGCFSLVVNQTESKALPPSNEHSLVFPGYPASKLRAEQIILAADKTPLPRGGYLRTIALRPTLLYGEQDCRLVTPLLKMARLQNGRLVRFAGPGGKQQITYVGNAAWAHIRAKDALLDNPGGAAGLPVFITDDTPIDDLLRFASRVTATADDPSLRCRCTRWYVPALLAYLLAAILERLITWCAHPLLRVRLPVSPSGVVSYLGSIVLYNRLRAAIQLDYSPVYSSEQAVRIRHLSLRTTQCADPCYANTGLIDPRPGTPTYSLVTLAHTLDMLAHSRNVELSLLLQQSCNVVAYQRLPSQVQSYRFPSGDD
uniref:(California timema) hypothetical protein n=1 Tax=Timema californicum TaxID=61474 RepID=A0A7R9J2V3_TIMCA|nr:unnamed protein product [Timema californicum]